MWAKLIVAVTLLPMLMHSILGCCWHHAHAEGRLNSAHAQSEAHTSNRHGHRHLCCHHDCNDASVPIEHNEPCDDVRCVYLVAQPMRSDVTAGTQAEFAPLHSDAMPDSSANVTGFRNPQPNIGVATLSQHRAQTQVWVL